MIQKICYKYLLLKKVNIFTNLPFEFLRIIVFFFNNNFYYKNN